ncbi:MAG: alpha/beta fold hydrolase [Smithella sp.]
MGSSEMKKSKASKSAVLIGIAILLVLTSVIGASVLQTSEGSVKVTDLKIETDQGILSMVMFKPNSATTENPAPAVIASHGMFNSKEMQDAVCVELSRRGVVVIAIDMFGHGLSDNADSPRYVVNNEGKYYNVDSASFVDNKADATAFNAHGMIEAVEYVWNNLNFVDHSRIGVTGHSMGGVISTVTMKYYHYQETVGDGVKKISAALMQACNEATLPGELDGTDVAYVNALYDEIFAWGMAFNPALPEMGIDTVPKLNQYQADTLMQTHAGYTGEYTIGTFEYDKDGNIRVYNTIHGDHPLVHFSIEATEDIITFFNAAFNLNSNLPATNQVWWVKEGFNALGLVGFFLFIVEFIALMLNTPFFKSLKIGKEALEDSKVEKPKTALDYTLYVLGILLLGLLPGLLYYPFMNLGWIPKSALFPQTMVNNQVVWLTLVGLIMVAYVVLLHYLYNKRKGFTLRNYGLKLRNEGETAGQGFLKVLKTILLAVVTVVAGYLIVFVLYGLFKADFRLFSLAVKIFNVDRIVLCLQYLVFFLIWSFGVNLAINMNFRKGMSEGLMLTITTIVNTIGVSIGLFTFYIPFVANGMPPNGEFINPILLFPIPVIVAIITIYARRIYKRTGNVYLATILNALLICLITVVNTHIAYPYWWI